MLMALSIVKMEELVGVDNRIDEVYIKGRIPLDIVDKRKEEIRKHHRVKKPPNLRPLDSSFPLCLTISALSSISKCHRFQAR